MASTESSSDPNGWVQSPPRVFVKIHSVASESTLNSQYGLILQYVADKQLYTVILCQSPQEIVSLKVENLTRCASWLEETRAAWQMMRHHPDAQRRYRQGMVAIQRLSSDTKTQYIRGLFLLIFAVLMYMPQNYRYLIETQVPYLGPFIVRRKIALVAFTLLLESFIGYYYRLGLEDATQQLELKLHHPQEVNGAKYAWSRTPPPWKSPLSVRRIAAWLGGFWVAWDIATDWGNAWQMGLWFKVALACGLFVMMLYL